ncbi:hypothetical protein KL86PLE_10053 [uncultured Pleomorphomonas sp.]|uniref:Uncharacterized protein n=1 Tax=uncultured Pleomorphomonas sp. TaxID=442121 RepID=A0A212KYD5_9HYPH|nr:hypothetical protein KL86PLE_10053 [uncultured Pleomorphomonas sp.]
MPQSGPFNSGTLQGADPPPGFAMTRCTAPQRPMTHRRYDHDRPQDGAAASLLAHARRRPFPRHLHPNP